MVYISSDGVVGGGRSRWSLSALTGLFFAILNLFVLLIRTMFQPDLTRHGTGYTSTYRPSSGGGGDPPGPPRRRMGGFGGSTDNSSAPMGGCGSCGCG